MERQSWFARNLFDTLFNLNNSYDNSTAIRVSAAATTIMMMVMMMAAMTTTATTKILVFKQSRLLPWEQYFFIGLLLLALFAFIHLFFDLLWPLSCEIDVGYEQTRPIAHARTHVGPCNSCRDDECFAKCCFNTHDRHTKWELQLWVFTKYFLVEFKKKRQKKLNTWD